MAKRKKANKYQVQVTGPFAGSVGDWRPGITGTLNQTGKPDAEASTFATSGAAYDALALVERAGGECRILVLPC